MSEETNFQYFENISDDYFIDNREEKHNFIESHEDLTGSTHADTSGSVQKKAPFKIEKVS